VPGRGLRYRVVVVGVGEPRAACQPGEPPRQLRLEALDVVAAELIDGDQDDQRRGLSGLLAFGTGRQKQGQDEDQR